MMPRKSKRSYTVFRDDFNSFNKASYTIEVSSWGGGVGFTYHLVICHTWFEEHSHCWQWSCVATSILFLNIYQYACIFRTCTITCISTNLTSLLMWNNFQVLLTTGVISFSFQNVSWYSLLVCFVTIFVSESIIVVSLLAMLHVIAFQMFGTQLFYVYTFTVY